MRTVRKSAQITMFLIGLLMAPGAVAQGLSPSGPSENPGGPGVPPPGTPPRTGGSVPDAPASHIACFNADTASGFLRVEWPDSRRWAIYSWAKGSKLHIYIGNQRAVWCWAAKLQGVTGGCVKEERFTKTVRTGCGPES
jgi:hypothetical protein